MKNKSTFSEFIKRLPTLKELTEETKLPYYYDLMWDCKTGADLMNPIFNFLDKKDVLRRLAEDGFNVKNLKYSEY